MANGLEAIEALKEVKPDLIITDVMMPTMGGPEFCRAVRAHPSSADIPIVFQTSVEEWAVRELFDDYDAFFLKPFAGKDFVAAIAPLVENGRASRADPAAQADSSKDNLPMTEAVLKFLQHVLPPAKE